MLFNIISLACLMVAWFYLAKATCADRNIDMQVFSVVALICCALSALTSFIGGGF